MPLDPSTFDYLSPTEQQVRDMQKCRDAATAYFKVVQDVAIDGPDKTYALRKLREVAMWVNVAITRHADGLPRRGPPADEIER